MAKSVCEECLADPTTHKGVINTSVDPYSIWKTLGKVKNTLTVNEKRSEFQTGKDQRIIRIAQIQTHTRSIAVNSRQSFEIHETERIQPEFRLTIWNRIKLRQFP